MTVVFIEVLAPYETQYLLASKEYVASYSHYGTQNILINRKFY